MLDTDLNSFYQYPLIFSKTQMGRYNYYHLFRDKEINAHCG